MNLYGAPEKAEEMTEGKSGTTYIGKTAVNTFTVAKLMNSGMVSGTTWRGRVLLSARLDEGENDEGLATPQPVGRTQVPHSFSLTIYTISLFYLGPLCGV